MSNDRIRDDMCRKMMGDISSILNRNLDIYSTVTNKPPAYLAADILRVLVACQAGCIAILKHGALEGCEDIVVERSVRAIHDMLAQATSSSVLESFFKAAGLSK